MITDRQVRLLRRKRMEGKTQKTAAAKAGMSVRSARKWGSGPLPSETRHMCLVVRNLCNDGLIGTGPFPGHTGLYGDYRRAIWHSTHPSFQECWSTSLRGVFAAEPQWLFDHPDSTRGFYVWSGGMVSGKRSPRRTARLAVVGAVSECNTDRTAINQTSRSTFRVWMRCVGGHRLWLLPSWPMAILAVRPLQGFEVGIGNAWTQSGNLARPYRTERRAIRTRRHVPRRPHGDTSLWAC